MQAREESHRSQLSMLTTRPQPIRIHTSVSLHPQNADEDVPKSRRPHTRRRRPFPEGNRARHEDGRTRNGRAEKESENGLS